MQHRNLLLFLLIFSLYSTGTVLAADKGGLALTMTSEREIQVVNERGETVLQRVPPSQVVPGDEVIYTIRYRNLGDSPAEKVTISNPIPEHLLYTAGSAESEGVLVRFSVDQGEHFAPPEFLRLTMADGRQRQATAADYTHIRWLLQQPVPPGKEGQVGYRARVR